MTRCLIVGGTGTLGTELVRRLYGDHTEIVVFSRDETKQQEMRRLYPKIDYVLGDIRERLSLGPVMKDTDVVFHVAALKHVDVLESNPTEAIKTNIQGTVNVAEMAVAFGVKHVVFSSTDKAVLPINVYGMTKGISERYLLNLNSRQKNTRFAVYRWGNVVGSRGSVVHSFAKSLRDLSEVSITDMNMTRFWIHIEDAVEFMLKTYRDAPFQKVMIPDMKSAAVIDLVRAMSSVLKIDSFAVKCVGIRPGEKIHEVVESTHDFCTRSDTSPKYSHAELVSMVERVIA